ncbi:MAG: insulinase family protein [Clostridiales bacterium]|nr:insulinase family protein [Clostridiales bacterium]
MELKTFPRLGESCYFERLENGMAVFVVPRPGYGKTFACVAVNCGGMDSRLDGGGCAPAGTAHFLEHKMFDRKDGSDHQAMTAAGASVNAFTSGNITAYYFSCTDRFPEHLRTLLRCVATPYFTPESVKKETGVILQELAMVSDRPGWRRHRQMLQGLYIHHPVRNPVIGDRSSIQKITAEMLDDYYNTYYYPGNMVLCVAGDVDPHQVVSTARMILPRERREPTARALEKEPLTAVQQETITGMAVSAPEFSLGLKLEPFPNGKAGLRCALLGELAAELVCGRSSPLYNRLYREGLLNRRFSLGCNSVPGAAWLTFGGESPDPYRVRDAILEEAGQLALGLGHERFQQALRAEYGASVRGLDRFDDLCFSLARGWFSDYLYLDFGELYPSLTIGDVRDFLGRAFRPERSALSVTAAPGQVKQAGPNEEKDKAKE